MTPTPRATGIIVCQQVIIDKHTNNPTCVGVLTALSPDEFPSAPRNISVFSALTDSLGSGIMKIVIGNLNDDSEIYANQWNIVFPDRLKIVHAVVVIREVVFPSPGIYVFSLFIDDEVVAEQRLIVRRRS